MPLFSRRSMNKMADIRFFFPQIIIFVKKIEVCLILRTDLEKTFLAFDIVYKSVCVVGGRVGVGSSVGAVVGSVVGSVVAAGGGVIHSTGLVGTGVVVS